MATPAKAKPKKPTGRNGKPANVRGAPRKFNRATVVKAICDRLATGEPLAVICRDLKVSVRTVNDWRAQEPEIAAQFDEARDLGFDAIAHDCLEIADDGTNDWKPGERGGLVLDNEAVQRSKLRIETRLKLLAKWDPRRYGEKLEHTGPNGGPIPVAATNVTVAAKDPVEAAAIYQKVMAGEG